MCSAASRMILPVILLVAWWGPISHASPLVIGPGRGIGPITLRMPAERVRQILGPPAAVASAREQHLWRFPSHGLTVWIAKGRVIRIRTTHPDHKTAAGLAPGDSRWEQARQALCHGGRNEASVTRATPTGFEVRCPLRGVILEVSQGYLASISVIPIEPLRPRRTLRAR